MRHSAVQVVIGHAFSLASLFMFTTFASCTITDSQIVLGNGYVLSTISDSSSVVLEYRPSLDLRRYSEWTACQFTVAYSKDMKTGYSMTNSLTGEHRVYDDHSEWLADAIRMNAKPQYSNPLVNDVQKILLKGTFIAGQSSEGWFILHARNNILSKYKYYDDYQATLNTMYDDVVNYQSPHDIIRWSNVYNICMYSAIIAIIACVILMICRARSKIKNTRLHNGNSNI